MSVASRYLALGIPTTVHIDLLSACDLDCTHCFLSDRTSKGLPKARWIELIDELADLGALYLLFSGGEIFVRRDALEILRHARRRMFAVKVISHGGRITEEVADELADMGVMEIGISLYSMRAEDHEAVTRVPGSHARTLAGIRRLRERAIPVQLKIPIMPQNQDSWQTVLPFARELGCEAQPGVAIFHRDDLDDEHYAGHDVGFEAKVEAHRQMFEATLEHGGSFGFDADDCAAPGDAPCKAGRTSVYIGPTGKVYPCTIFYWEVGDLATASFADIWRTSPRLQRIRQIDKSSFGQCTGCNYYGGCGHCMAKQFHETGDPASRSELVCADGDRVYYLTVASELVCADTHSRFAAAKLLGLYDGPTGPPGTGRAHLAAEVALDEVPDILSMAG